MKGCVERAQRSTVQALGEGVTIVDWRAEAGHFPKAQMLCPERGGSQMQASSGDRDLEQGVAHVQATAAQNLMRSSLLGRKNPRLSVFKYEMQVPPSGHHGEMRLKRWVEARWLTQAGAEPTKSSASPLGSGFLTQPPQGKERITRIAHKERRIWDPL